MTTQFQPDQWIFIGDKSCAHSETQIKALQELKYDIKGGIMCNEEKNKNIDACKQIEYFPTFCNTLTKTCVSGLRTTKEEFYKLQAISDAEKKN